MSFFARSAFDEKLVDMVKDATPPASYSARNAIRHLEKAATIAEADPEMAAFRGITAEEESATAVFLALRNHAYPSSSRLKPRDHLHKNALFPFIVAMSGVFATADEHFHLQSRLRIGDDHGKPRLLTEIHVGGVGLGDRFGFPQPPLNIAVSRGDALHEFEEQLAQLATAKGAASIKAHLQARANLRNRILYASPSGLPSVTLNTFLDEQRRAVKTNLGAFLMIDPYPEHQLLVRQALRAFLKMLKALPPELARLGAL